MKRLLIFRHSYAQPSREAPDRLRQLTEMGVKTARLVMRELVTTRGYAPDLGLASPYLRTRQTLACLQEACREAGLGELPVIEFEGLCADADPALALSHLEGIAADTVVAVGHMPLVGDLVLQATCREIDFNPCDLVVLGFDGAWRLEHHLTYSDFL